MQRKMNLPKTVNSIYMDYIISPKNIVQLELEKKICHYIIVDDIIDIKKIDESPHKEELAKIAFSPNKLKKYIAMDLDLCDF